MGYRKWHTMQESRRLLLISSGSKLVFSVLLLLLLGSCSSDDPVPLKEAPHKLVFVYMVADNNLDYFAVQDLNEMEAAFPKNTKDKLVVYVDRGRNGRPSHPYLMEINHDKTDAIISPILRSFPEQNSADAQVFHSVLKEVFDYYKNENFSARGLVLWSHGNAWLPNGVSILTNRDKLLEEEEQIKSFGLDNVPETSNMDIKKLAKVLGNYHFEFLLFDACFMSSIEVIYELRNTADYLIASPTEILSNGFPYQHVVPLFFQKKAAPRQIAKRFYTYYNGKKGLLRSASVAVIKMDELENLKNRIYDFSVALSAKQPRVLHKKKVLQLDRFDGAWIYDLRDFLQKTALANDLTKEYKKIMSQWPKTLIYEDNTPFMVKTVDLARCHGISTYIPDRTHTGKVNQYYKTLSWFKAGGYDKVFDF